MGLTIEVILAKDLVTSPWKNGGGNTREIKIFPPQSHFDDCMWRISLADVKQSGPFSEFPGIDRHIVLTQGTDMLLHHTASQKTHPLEPFVPYPFAGEDPISSELLKGATSDFNLMVRRNQAKGSVVCWQTTQSTTLVNGYHLFYSAQGHHQLQIAEHTILLTPGDSVYLQSNNTAAELMSQPLDDSSQLIVATIQPHKI